MLTTKSSEVISLDAKKENPHLIVLNGITRVLLLIKKRALDYHSWNGLKYDAPTAVVQTKKNIMVSLLIGLERQGCGLSPHLFDLPIRHVAIVLTGVVITGTPPVGEVPKVMLYADDPPLYMRPKLLMLGHFRRPSGYISNYSKSLHRSFQISIQNKLQPL